MAFKFVLIYVYRWYILWNGRTNHFPSKPHSRILSYNDRTTLEEYFPSCHPKLSAQTPKRSSRISEAKEKFNENYLANSLSGWVLQGDEVQTKINA